MKKKLFTKKRAKTVAVLGMGFATVATVSMIQSLSTNAAVDFSTYKNNLMSQMNSQGNLEMEIENNGAIDHVNFYSSDLDVIADKVAQVQYYTANLSGGSGTPGASSMTGSAVVVTDENGSITTQLKDTSGNLLNNAVTTAELDCLKQNASVTINEYDTSGIATGATQTVSSVTLKDLYNSGSSNLDGSSFDGTGNVQTNLDELESIIEGIENAGWN